jgi:YidC/Oxa1 family membrane protein insertase
MFLQPLIEQLKNQSNIKYVVLTTTDKYKDIQVDAPVIFISDKFWRFMKGALLLTGNSGVPKDLISGFHKRVHSFHSPVSMLRIYPSHAFDAYNYFFAAGRHHIDEVKYLFKKRSLPEPVVFEVGYMRIESIYQFSLDYAKKLTGVTIIIAPSWGEKNIINLFGYQIIEQLLLKGNNVILRPHPGNEIYNADYIAKIKEGFSEHPRFYYDSWTGMDALCEADILIGDWSGISFEFACALNKPVIFIDTEPKDNAEMPSARDIFECYAREKVGQIISVTDINQLNDVIFDILLNIQTYQKMIVENKKELFFNCPQCASEVLASVSKLMCESYDR